VPNRNILAAFMVVALGVAFACATNYTPETKALFCKQAINTLVAPECVRFDELDQRYVDLCIDVVEDATVACDAGFLDDPIQMCAKIGEKAVQCDIISEGDTSPSEAKLRNVATCKRVVAAASLACTIALAETVAAPE
jgi:hypothetical protein